MSEQPAIAALERSLWTEPSLLFVPVDATFASRRVLDVAIAFAQERGTPIVLVGLLAEPSPLWVDPDELFALTMAAEYGYGVFMPRYPLDEEGGLTRLVRLVLAPYQRRAAAAGVAASMRVLRANQALEQLTQLMAETPPEEPALILGEPRTLEGELGQVTQELLATCTCSHYVVRFLSRRGRHWWRSLGRRR